MAQFPAERRDESRLMVVRADGRTGGRADGNGVTHLVFRDFPSLLLPNDLLVINDSRVIPARLLPVRRGGGAAEVLLVAREADGSWRALVKPGARIRPGGLLRFDDGDGVEILEHLPSGERRVRLAGPGGDDGVLARHGVVPLPPYITREPTNEDRERYQTVYANEPGSVAAPTAGLHFTPEVMRRCEAQGARFARVTLHVGPGTFRPVSVENPEEHRMDAEAWQIPEATAQAVAETRAAGGRVWAVGTTALRTLESAGRPDGTVAAGAAWTTLFVRPGYTFRVVDCLLTNFHLPRSTLLMLVSAFGGTERILEAYREAVRLKYRFYSYGDAMAIVKGVIGDR